MKQSEMDMLRYRHAALIVSPNTSNGQREDSTVIIGLLDLIRLYQDELDRVHAKLAKATEESNEADS